MSGSSAALRAAFLAIAAPGQPTSQKTRRRTMGSDMKLARTAIAVAGLALCVQGTEIWVAVTGDDQGPGTRESPFASVEKAQQAVRALHRDGLQEDVLVHLTAGVYELPEPLTFGPDDGGTGAHAVTYVGEPGNPTVLSGGRRIRGWTITPEGLWTAVLPEVVNGTWQPRQLVVHGRTAQRARWPNVDAPQPYGRVKAAALAEDRSRYTVSIDSSAVSAWNNVSEVEIVVCGNWEITRKKLLSVDPQSGTLTLAPPHAGAHPAIRPVKGRFFFLENAREFLDQPGEWYLDVRTGQLTYSPRPEDVLATSIMEMPRLTRLLDLQGTPERPVRNLHFQGLHFACADWDFPDYGFNGIQASFHTFPTDGQKGWVWFPWLGTKPALQWEFAEACTLQNGVLRNLGGVGLHLKRGCSRNTVEGNLVEEVGANGIMIGENLVGFPWGKETLPPGELPVGNRVANNIVRRCGLDDYGAVGIWVSFTDGTHVAHNLLYDLPYSGISVGWMWNENPTDNRNNLIEANHVHTVLQKLCDGGCLYTLGRQPGTVIRGNRFHNVLRSETAQGAPNNGIFFDQGSKGFLVENNLIYATSGEPIRFNQCRKEWHTWGRNFFGMPRKVPGKRGAALGCDGQSAGFEVPHTTELDPLEITAEAWIRRRRFAAHGDRRRWVINKNDDEWTDGHWALMVNDSKAGAYLNIGGGRENSFEAWSEEGVLKLGTWQHLAVTYDGKDLRVYTDGKEVACTAINRARVPGTLPLAIGRRQDAYNSFLGAIDEAVVYAGALSPPQILARARADGAPPLASLPVVGQWDFESLDDKTDQLQQVEKSAGLEPRFRKRMNK